MTRGLLLYELGETLIMLAGVQEERWAGETLTSRSPCICWLLHMLVHMYQVQLETEDGCGCAGGGGQVREGGGDSGASGGNCGGSAGCAG